MAAASTVGGRVMQRDRDDIEPEFHLEQLDKEER